MMLKPPKSQAFCPSYDDAPSEIHLTSQVVAYSQFLSSRSKTHILPNRFDFLMVTVTHQHAQCQPEVVNMQGRRTPDENRQYVSTSGSLLALYNLHLGMMFLYQSKGINIHKVNNHPHSFPNKNLFLKIATSPFLHLHISNQSQTLTLNILPILLSYCSPSSCHH